MSDLYDSFFKVENSMEPYSDSREHIDELFSLLDLCFAVILSARGVETPYLLKAGEAGRIPELSVSSSDAAGLILPADSPLGTGGISEKAREQIWLGRIHIMQRIKLSEDSSFIPRFEVLKRSFALDEFESFAMLLALSSEYDRKYEGIYSRLHNNSSDYYATKWLALRLYEILFGTKAASRARVIGGTSPLCRFLCSKELKRHDRSEISERLVLSRRAVSFLLGNNTVDPMLSDCCTIVNFKSHGYVHFREEEAKQISDLLVKKTSESRNCFVVNLYGPDGIGRTTTACRAADIQGMKLLKVRLNELMDKAGAERDKYLDMVFTETVLTGALPCFAVQIQQEATDYEDERHVPSNDDAEYAARRISEMFRFVFWLTAEKDNCFSGTDAETISFEFPMLSANERFLFWVDKLPEGGSELMSYANRYILTPNSIEKSADLAKLLASSEKKPLDDSHITRAVRQYSVNQLGGYAQRINAVFTWDDLVVSDEQKRRMKMICDQVKYRSVVNEDWGFRRRAPYGRGLCALFYGSPGTGKTMAVQVMANELGLDAYRIDLSQLSSKYIGETQKNISRLFDKAKNINAMLFFDEADSMFAKRSEVKDANDRYANADTAFLLQKLEDHEGITILATNYVNNIDDAFKRRIKFMINFVFPSADVRLELWKKILPDEARVDEPLDFEFYAEHFELSGSNIKEILTNAAYLAASEGSGIRNSHIIEAIKLNFSKYGKILTNADFGYLGG